MTSLRLHGLRGTEQRGGRRYQGELCLTKDKNIEIGFWYYLHNK